MPAGDLGLHVLGLLVYPGTLLALAVGVVAEITAGLALGGGGPRAALLAPFLRLRGTAASAMPLLLVAALLSGLAATQLGIPLSPVSPVERNLLAAAVALAGAMWLGWARAWAASGARLTLLAQVCWLVALLAPALVSVTLRPAALGAVAVPAELPLKLAAGLLALLCLPALLQLLPGAAPGEGTAEGDEVAALRVFLWLPISGLVASLFFPPGADDAGGALRFVGITLGTAAAAIGLAGAAARSGPAVRRLYPRLLAPAALGVLVLAAVTSLQT